MAVMLSAAGVFRLALPLAFVVVVAGAYTRIADAGLGCPDWPGCYGKLVGIPSAAEADAYLSGEGEDNGESNGGDNAADNTPAYDRKKAAIEIAHRYIAGFLGLLIFAGAFLAWRERRDVASAFNNAKAKAAAALALLVCFQAILGMITVTDNLRPAVVVAHLLGGMLILFVLARLAFARAYRGYDDDAINNNGGGGFAVIAVLVLFAQIALGGWVSANYAGLACGGFPQCQGGWMPHSADFSGFDPRRALHQTTDGAQVSNAALATMHWLHRIGAVVAFVVLASFALLRASGGWRGNRGNRGQMFGGGILLALLIAQVGLGIAVVVLHLPVALALLHNAAAAMLVIVMAVLSARR